MNGVACQALLRSTTQRFFTGVNPGLSLGRIFTSTDHPGRSSFSHLSSFLLLYLLSPKIVCSRGNLVGETIASSCGAAVPSSVLAPVTRTAINNPSVSTSK